MKDIDISYFNDMLVRLEEIFFHQLGEVSFFMGDLVGIDFIQSRKIEGDTLDKVVDNCIKEIIAAGIAKDITYSINGLGMLLTLKTKGCIHLTKEVRRRKDSVRPFICPVGNMIMDSILSVLNWDFAKVNTTYPFVVDENKQECIVKCVICKNAEKIGEVSDSFKAWEERNR